MRMQSVCLSLALAVSAGWAPAAEEAPSLDVRRAVPAEAYMAVYAKHNPERDFQRRYLEEVWDTVEQTQIVERAVKIVTDRVSEEDLEAAKSILDELREAADPIDFEAILDAKEFVYGQVMEPGSGKQPFSGQHVALLRMTPEAAEACKKGLTNLFALVEKHSKGEVSVETAEEGDVALTFLATPGEFPLRPTVATIDDVLLVSTSEQFARKSLRLLTTEEGESKFDDPRLAEALSRLPEPEDSLVFYDQKTQFEQMRELSAFIRREGAGDPAAEKVAELVDLVFDEIAVLDYEVTVEYTEGNLNRSAVYGKVVPGAERKLLAKMVTSGKPFEPWDAWVPAEALSYSLNTGIDLHPAYEWVMEVLEERVPEAEPVLERFEEMQSELEVYLDRDILRAFSGETVSVSLPAATPSVFGGQDSVLALRCRKPDRIRELLHRLIEKAQEHPMVKAQQFELTECEKLEGFEELSALLLGVFGVRPAIGFRDGWMFIGSNAAAVQKVLDTKAGEGETIAETEAFKRFHLEVEGPVDAIAYTDLAASTRQVAQMLNQVGIVAQIVIGLAGAEADDEDLEPVKEVLKLLPSVAKIVAKFDFLEAKLSVTQTGDEPGTYTRRSVIVVRAPESEEAETE